ncbi:hypothetical protein SAMN05443574_102333 [Haloarcula vallismortis]|uniref:Uncharacterized protein n=2 Tax=Haloarcula vallismortis TaxID=28442 RepID=M0J769_HALVA|nr:hypothetical protein [Haloarcula vallismortis]EMA03849.1 hypothetical protein C437_14787 [Haloarcula vallismortis ATCC 29715]SDW30162.1 hypothetical protein SAMN05443574_102333 [Haloarcula vallismortis]
MPTFTTRLADGWKTAGENISLVLIPILLAVMQTDSIRQILTYDGAHIGVKFGVPASVVTIWQFVSLPGSGVTTNTGLPLSAPYAMIVIPAVILLRAGLSGGYFGTIAAELLDRHEGFAMSAIAYFVPFLVITTLPYIVLAPLALGLFGFGSLGDGGAVVGAVFLLIPAFIAAGYLFWATPYLIVLRRTGVVAAARGSYKLAVNGGPYLSYTIGYVGLVLLVSAVATAVVVNLPTVGIPFGILIGGVLGLTLNVTTMRFVADIDPESPAAGGWSEQHRSSEAPINT